MCCNLKTPIHSRNKIIHRTALGSFSGWVAINWCVSSSDLKIISRYELFVWKFSCRCSESDVVLFVWGPTYNHYLAFLTPDCSMHFLHTDCLEALGLQAGAVCKLCIFNFFSNFVYYICLYISDLSFKIIIKINEEMFLMILDLIKYLLSVAAANEPEKVKHKHWVVAEVVCKEFCQAKKVSNH